MKVSKRTLEARELRITKPHITLEGGDWGYYGDGIFKNGHCWEAAKFCAKLNKAKG